MIGRVTPTNVGFYGRSGGGYYGGGDNKPDKDEEEFNFGCLGILVILIAFALAFLLAYG